MKLTLKRDELVRVLEPCIQIADPANPVAAMRCVLLSVFEAEENTGAALQVASMGLGGIRTAEAVTPQVDVRDGGELCVPARAIYAIVQSLPSEEIEISDQSGQCVITGVGVRRRHQLVTLDPAEFPVVPRPDQSPSAALGIRVPGKILAGLVNRVRHSIDPTTRMDQHHLYGVLIDYDSSALTTVAISSSSWSRDTLLTGAHSTEWSCLVSYDFLSALTKLCGASELVSLRLDNVQNARRLFAIDGAGTILSCAAPHAAYPPWRELIGRYPPTHYAVCSREALLELVRGITAALSGATIELQTSVASGEITARVWHDSSLHETSLDEGAIPAVVVERDNAVLISSSLLLDALRGIGGEEIAIGGIVEMHNALHLKSGSAETTIAPINRDVREAVAPQVAPVGGTIKRRASRKRIAVEPLPVDTAPPKRDDRQIEMFDGNDAYVDRRTAPSATAPSATAQDAPVQDAAQQPATAAARHGVGNRKPRPSARGAHP